MEKDKNGEKMKRSYILKIIYLVIIAASLIAVIYADINRHNAESSSKTVEIIADYEEFSVYADQIGQEPSEVLAKTGFQSAVLKERNLFDLAKNMSDLEYKVFYDLKKDVDWEAKLTSEVIEYLKSRDNKMDMIVMISNKNLYLSLKKAAEQRYDIVQYFEGENGFGYPRYYMVFDGVLEDLYEIQHNKISDSNHKGLKNIREIHSSAIEELGLGYDEESVQQIKDSGLKLILRPTNYKRADTDKLIKAYWTDAKKYGAEKSGIIFQGRSVSGYELGVRNFSQEFVDRLKADKIPMYFIERPDQLGYLDIDGYPEIARASNYNIVRMMPIVEYIQKYYNYLGVFKNGKEVENILFRAVVDRNIRAFYMRPFKLTGYSYIEEMDGYAQMMQNLKTRMKPHGLKFGSAAAMDIPRYSRIPILFAGFGIVVFAIITIRIIFNTNRIFELICLVLGMLGTVMALKVAPTKAMQLLAFAGSIVFPVLAFTFLMEYIKDIVLSKRVLGIWGVIGRCITGFIATTSISVVGGLYIGAILSRIDFLLEFNFFRGVKLSMFLPIIAAIAIYALKMGFASTVNRGLHYNDLIKMLNANVKLYTLFVAAFIGVIGLVYMSRSGNTSGLRVLNAEVYFRNFLENALMVRPRTKEVLIAFPSLFIALFLALRGYKRLVFPFAVASVLGLSSIVNSFCHTRTSLYVSALRGLFAIGISIAVGIIIILVLEFINKRIVSIGAEK